MGVGTKENLRDIRSGEQAEHRTAPGTNNEGDRVDGITRESRTRVENLGERRPSRAWMTKGSEPCVVCVGGKRERERL